MTARGLRDSSHVGGTQAETIGYVITV
jgi:hypothetical protein